MIDPTSPSTEPAEPEKKPAAADPKEPAAAAAGGASGTQAEPAPVPNEPKEKINEEASIRDALRRGRADPRRILLECFSIAFHNEDALRNFCFAHFPEFYPELKETDRRSGILRDLISYCEGRDRVAQLWDWLANENRPRYDEWFPRWSKACKTDRDSREAKYAEFRGSASPPRSGNEKGPAEHPLSSGDAERVSDWFFTELAPLDRATVLTTALFEGMNRTYLVQVARDLEKLLDPATDQPIDNGSTPE
jgi:hypothetical protein